MHSFLRVPRRCGSLALVTILAALVSTAHSAGTGEACGVCEPGWQAVSSYAPRSYNEDGSYTEGAREGHWRGGVRVWDTENPSREVMQGGILCLPPLPSVLASQPLSYEGTDEIPTRNLRARVTAKDVDYCITGSHELGTFQAVEIEDGPDYYWKWDQQDSLGAWQPSSHDLSTPFQTTPVTRIGKKFGYILRPVTASVTSAHGPPHTACWSVANDGTRGAVVTLVAVRPVMEPKFSVHEAYSGEGSHPFVGNSNIVHEMFYSSRKWIEPGNDPPRTVKHGTDFIRDRYVTWFYYVDIGHELRPPQLGDGGCPHDSPISLHVRNERVVTRRGSPVLDPSWEGIVGVSAGYKHETSTKHQVFLTLRQDEQTRYFRLAFQPIQECFISYHDRQVVRVHHEDVDAFDWDDVPYDFNRVNSVSGGRADGREGKLRIIRSCCETIGGPI